MTTILLSCLLLLNVPVNGSVAVPIESGQVAKVNGYILTRRALASLLAAPEKQRQMCEVQKDHITKLSKLELDKQIEKITAEYESRLRIAALSKSPAISQPKSDKLLILGAFSTGVIVGIISFFAIRAAGK